MNTQDTQKKDFESLLALASTLKTILENSKKANRVDLTNTFIIKAWSHYEKYGDSSIFKKLFFIRIDNSTLYNRLNLKAYFKSQGFDFDYNVKTDSLVIMKAMSKNDCKLLQTFKEYNESLENEKKKARLNESNQEKLARLYKARFDKLTKSDKAILITFLKNN